jgi:diaminohydroxyphosphoribosylaminopyrimidine deaminase/5-amino-6-(5-phosphoribosylamino)uracil reductase
MYVSLEPCAHYGKTPPCANLIIEKKIPRVVVGCRDPFPEVDGKGIERIKLAGVEVELGVLEKECILLNRRFFTFHTRHRPYIVLKWAQSADGKLAAGDGTRVSISNEYSNRLVHRWRSEEASILVGTNTALSDDPALTARLWTGPDPVRLVIDKDLRLPGSLKVFDGQVRTIVFNTVRQEERGNVLYYKLNLEEGLVAGVVSALYALDIQSVLVEGGTQLLQSFIDAGIWDEVRTITNNELEIPGGFAGPVLKDAQLLSSETLLSDAVRYYGNPLLG